MKVQRPRPYANGVARARVRIEDPDGPRAGMLSQTERKLREAITDAYLALSALAEVEEVVAKTLTDARRDYADTGSTPDETERLAEAIYCYGPSITNSVAHARLLAPVSVMRRFEWIAERPRRLDRHLPEPARAVAYGGYSVSEWLEELLELADLLDAYHDAITVSMDELVDVDEDLAAYVIGDRVFRPSATVVRA